jgi:hypothetical protein
MANAIVQLDALQSEMEAGRARARYAAWHRIGSRGPGKTEGLPLGSSRN